MVMAGMLLGDWISFVICWCGHMVGKHSLHKGNIQPGSISPVYGTCSMCEECKQFWPGTAEDRRTLERALGLVMEDAVNGQLAIARGEREIITSVRVKLDEQLTEADRETVASAIQPKPHGTGRTITPLVIADLEERRRFGMAKYGEELTAFNSRDPLQDAYQEALDLTVYLRQAIEERDQNVLNAQHADKEQRE